MNVGVQNSLVNLHKNLLAGDTAQRDVVIKALIALPQTMCNCITNKVRFETKEDYVVHVKGNGKKF
jgi:hypothetical protein